MDYQILDCNGRRKVISCNFNLLSGGQVHPDRILPDMHDLLYILEGGWEVEQNHHSYSLQKDDMIFLHAGGRHGGSSGCLPNTLVMFLHISALPGDCHITQYPEQSSWDDALAVPEVVHCQQSGIIRRCFQNIIYHFYSNRPNIQLKLSPLVQDLFYELHALSTGEQTERVEDELVKQVIYRLRTSPQSDTLGRLAEDFGVSESTLSNRFKRATGSTLYRYQLETKLEMARSLLLSGESAPLEEIARLYGFCDRYHFSKLFQKQYGITPAALRKQLKEGKEASSLLPLWKTEEGMCW